MTLLHFNAALFIFYNKIWLNRIDLVFITVQKHREIFVQNISLPEHGPGPPSMFPYTDEIPPNLVISEEEVIDQFKLLDNSKHPGANWVS